MATDATPSARVRLTGDQLSGLACVRCGERLPRHPGQVRELPAVEDRGHTYRAFAHTPRCPPPRRVPGAVWPSGGAPATATAAFRPPP